MIIDQYWINGISEKHQRAILKKHPGAIKYINEPSFPLVKMVIDIDVDCISNDVQMCEHSQMYLVSLHPDMFYLISDPVEEVIDQALTARPANIQYVKNPSDEQLINVFSQDPKLIRMFDADKLANMSDHVKSYARIIM